MLWEKKKNKKKRNLLKRHMHGNKKTYRSLSPFPPYYLIYKYISGGYTPAYALQKRPIHTKKQKATEESKPGAVSPSRSSFLRQSPLKTLSNHNNHLLTHLFEKIYSLTLLD
jgi:hypothetical protein